MDLEQQQQQQQQQENGNTATPTDNDDNNSNDNGGGEMLLEATLVEDHHHHHDHHGDNDNNAEVMTAAKVVEAEELYCGFSRRQWLSLGGCLVCLVAVVAVVISLAVVNNDSNSLQDTPPSASMAPTPTPRPTLEMIRDRGFVKCGIWKESLDFFQWAETYNSKDDQVDFVLVRSFIFFIWSVLDVDVDCDLVFQHLTYHD